MPFFALAQICVCACPESIGAAKDAIKEQKLLSHLELLPLAVPKSLGIGNPDSDYPWHWSIYNWLDGNNACDEQITDPDLAAGQLADFFTSS
jgi:aminoglycoside phosphotransferase (APT) family kinase protein